MTKSKNNHKFVCLEFPIIIETWKSDFKFYMLLPVTFLIIGLYGWDSIKISLLFFLIFILTSVFVSYLIPIKHIFRTDKILVTYIFKKTKTIEPENLMNIKFDTLHSEVDDLMDIDIENIKFIYKDKQRKMVKSLDISLEHFNDCTAPQKL